MEIRKLQKMLNSEKQEGDYGILKLVKGDNV